MAQLERPSGEAHVFHGAAETHAAITRSHEYEEDHGHHHEKKSVLTKVKEKAKRWRNILHKKKHGHEGIGDSTPPWGVSLEEDDDVDDEEDPEFHGAPMYESEMAPEVYRDATTTDFSPRKEMADHEHHQQHIQSPTILVKHIPDGKCNSTTQQPVAATTITTTKTLTQTVTEIFTPAYNMVTEVITSKIQTPRDEAVSKQVWDKGVSVKEYLLQKLEPGEDDKALSQVISEAISPRMRGSASDVGVMEKMKSLILGAESPTIPISTSNYRGGTCPSATGKPPQLKMLHSDNGRDQRPMLETSRSLPASVTSGIYPSRKLASSNNRPAVMPSISHAGEIGEGGERTLQEYLN